jgi:Mrp family chromosome partitioning ATPase
VPGLHILHGNAASARPFEMLASPRMLNLVEQLKREMDILLIAASPVQSFADSLILATHVDGVILVAGRGATSRKEVSSVLENLRAIGTPVIGSILVAGRRPVWRGLSKTGKAWLPFSSKRPAPAPTQDDRVGEALPALQLDDVEHSNA